MKYWANYMTGNGTHMNNGITVTINLPWQKKLKRLQKVIRPKQTMSTGTLMIATETRF